LFSPQFVEMLVAKYTPIVMPAYTPVVMPAEAGIQFRNSAPNRTRACQYPTGVSEISSRNIQEPSDRLPTILKKLHFITTYGED
jgi:hypothetical protein